MRSQEVVRHARRLWFEGSSDHALVEHNVIKDGSWPVQSVGGEFRYNLLINSGHNFWRSAADNTQIHHNLFVHANSLNTEYDGGIEAYTGETGLNIYNNTFDVGGSVGSFNAPGLRIDGHSRVQSLRNNLFTSFTEVSAMFDDAFISTVDSTVSAPRVGSADYNAFFNPLAPNTAIRSLTGPSHTGPPRFAPSVS